MNVARAVPPEREQRVYRVWAKILSHGLCASEINPFPED